MTTKKSNLRDDVSSDAENWLNDCFRSDERLSITDELEKISKTDLCGLDYLSELLATIITAGRRVERIKGGYTPNEWMGALLSHIAVELQESLTCAITVSRDTLEELATAESRIVELEETVSNAVYERDILAGRLGCNTLTK